MPSVDMNASKPNVRPYVPEIYLARLIVRRDGAEYLNITTPMPENFSFSLSSDYSSPLDQPLSSLVNGGGAMTDIVKSGAKAMTGMSTSHKYLSGKVWTGSSGLGISIPFVLQAQTNAKQDVMDRLVRLMEMAVPSEDGPGGLLRAPGPSLLNMDAIASGDFSSATWGGDDITVSIGKFLTLNPCVIRSVSPVLDTMFDVNGTPISVVVTVSFESYFTMTKEDLMKAFGPSITFRS